MHSESPPVQSTLDDQEHPRASGRPLGDLSNVEGTPLNTDATADAATTYYGPITHPTIEDIAVMVDQFWTRASACDPTLRQEDLRLWKMDLKGAYKLLSFRAEHVGLFGMLLTGDLVYLQIAGIIDWAETPAAFQVVTRAIAWEPYSDVCGRHHRGQI